MKKLVLLFSFLLLSQIVLGQALPQADPASVGVNPSRLERIDQLIETYIQRGWLPGGVFLIARKGKTVYHKSFGVKDPVQKKNYQKNDIFRIASMTKAITTVATLQLFEQGKLGLDDPVYAYIPAFKDAQVLDKFNNEDSSYTTVPAKSPVTIRQLLTHTSGITYGDFNPGKLQAVYADHDMTGVGLSHEEWSTKEFINRLARVPLAFQPGEKYLYGLSMDVLGRVIEVISGQPLDEYFEENIFKPLGLQDTYFYLPGAKHARLVPLYTLDKKRSLAIA
ncbi:MAG: serine hydrolase domain-containing protein, partial [Bacteroidota bacterium]